MKPTPIKPNIDQESVWDYPRPPRLEPVRKTLAIYFNGEVVARTNKAYRVLETSHPPVYYLPPEDVNSAFLIPSHHNSFCEFKGKGNYFHVKVGSRLADNAAWYYPNPAKAFLPIKNYLAFYAHKMDKCLVDEEVVQPQPGNFYGGWITRNIVGPFKGVEDSWGW